MTDYALEMFLDREAQVISQIRDVLIAIQDEHETHCPGTGEACLHDRCKKIAFLAHCLGIKGPDAWQAVCDMTGEYDRGCTHKDESHLAN